MIEALDMYRANCDSVVFTTQVAVGIITLFIAAFGIFISILAYINFKAADIPKKELEQLKEEIEKIVKNLENTKKEYKEQLEKNSKDISDLLRDDAEKYLEKARTSLGAEDFYTHFLQLQLYFLTLNKMILGELELFNLRNICLFLGIYRENKDKIQEDSYYGFIENLLSLAKICEDKKNQKYLEALMVLYNEFCEIFSYESVKASLSEYLRYGTDNGKEILELAERYLYKDNDL